MICELYLNKAVVKKKKRNNTEKSQKPFIPFLPKTTSQKTYNTISQLGY